MDIRLDGKAALITGGSRGIGKAIAKEYAASGAKVLITSRKAEACEEAAAEIGHGCIWEAGNAGNPEDAERVTDRCLRDLGGLDLLVNNAATNPYAGPTIDVDMPRWQKTFDVNVTAPLMWTQLAWRKYMQEHGGAIINISSVGGFLTNESIGVYDITKSALIHLTRQLAPELGPKVRINALCPGLIKTDFARFLWEGERGAEVAQRYPMKRLGEVEDIANAATYLASDEAAGWITGQTLILDGGGIVAFNT